MKETLHNSWSTGDREVPQTVNAVYNIAANWIKVKAVDRPGQATMFVTSRVDTPVTKKKGSTPKGSNEAKKTDAKSKSEKEAKLAKVECLPATRWGTTQTSVP